MGLRKLACCPQDGGRGLAEVLPQIGTCFVNAVELCLRELRNVRSVLRDAVRQGPW